MHLYLRNSSRLWGGRRRLLLANTVLLAAMGSPLYGQTFLEKLESAVRQRLDSALPPPPNAIPAAQPSGNELPPPQTNSGINQLPSILDEGPRGVPEQPGSAPLDPNTTPPVSADSERRPYLGLEAEEVVGGGIGVRITNVTQGSPAWKAGFEVGDRITAVNGFAIANLDGMVAQLGKSSPGQSVKFLVSRADRNLELVAVLMEAGLAERIAGGLLPIGPQGDSPAAATALAGPPWLGVTVNDLTPAFRQQFGLTVFRGAAVTGVAPQSPAAQIGIQAGDAILSIGGAPIETARDLMTWMSSARPGQKVDVTYQRGVAARTAPLTLEVSPENRPRRAANRAAIPAPSGSSSVPAVPTEDLTFNDSVERTNPLVVPPAEISLPTPEPAGSSQVVELQAEIVRLRAELDTANRRLESAQNQLKQILDGLGGK